jgi:hypothetical protein
MNKILKFVKIGAVNDPLGSDFSGVGMGGNIFMVLNSLLNMNEDDRLYVDMETENCVCTEHNFDKFNTNNCWEYYYDQMNKVNGKVYSLYDDKSFLNYKKVNLGNAELQHRFNNNFKLKSYLQHELDSYYNNNLKDKITLGVQIRLTDMKQHHNVAELLTYINKINDILKNNPEINQIFLATDDSTIIQQVQKQISVPVLYHHDFIRATADDPHLNPRDRHNYVNEFHNYRLSLECIKEIYTLSMCNSLLRADVSAISNVAILLSTKINKVHTI